MSPANTAFRLALLATLLVAGNARAADTLEVWEGGQADLETYLFASRLNLQRQAPGLSSDHLVGFGVTDRLSFYAGATLATDAAFDERSGSLYVGGFANVLDTAHFDVDVLLDLAAGGPRLNELQVLPLVELNVDTLPDGELGGLYARFAMPMGTAERASGSDPFFRPAGALDNSRPDTQPVAGATYTPRPSPWSKLVPRLSLKPPFSTPTQPGCDCETAPAPGVSVGVVTTVGTYLTLFERHQFLVELDVGTTLLSPQKARPLDIGGVALGYNVALADSLEVLSEVYFDIPQDDEVPSVTFMTGVILVVPTGLTFPF